MGHFSNAHTTPSLCFQQPGHDGHSAGPQQNERQAESDNDVSSLEFGEDDSESDNDRSISSNSSESSESDHDGSIFSSGSESNEGDSEPNNDRSSFSSGSESSEDDWDSKDGPGGSNRHFSQAGNSYQCTAATNVEDSDDASVDSAEVRTVSVNAKGIYHKRAHFEILSFE